MHPFFWFLPRPVRLLILKDLRTFLRDPAQWSQFLIFFGLLAFLLHEYSQAGLWRANAILAKPRQLSQPLRHRADTLNLHQPLHLSLALAGRPKFLGAGPLAPSREQILWGKFVFAAGISLVSTEILVVLSDLMLRMSPAMILLHVGMIAVLCLGLSGISVGLGARLPNLRETDPSKIAAGFGGTLNLLVSLVFIFSIVTALAVPCHLYFAGQEHPETVTIALSHGGFRFWLSAAILASLAVGILGTLVPLRIGIKAFQRMEF